ncbi:MAG: hypothetical protein E6J81_15405 [Deltaproteobacteria bacterium]|nr:MAG: hypothetical protein E6J81_15405 [Deltaproteobacteria bacterium]
MDDLNVRSVLIDGLHFRDHVILLALGVDSQGQKRVLALWEGTTENATVCRALLADLRKRGLDLAQEFGDVVQLDLGGVERRWWQGQRAGGVSTVAWGDSTGRIAAAREAVDDALASQGPGKLLLARSWGSVINHRADDVDRGVARRSAAGRRLLHLRREPE